MHDSTRPTRYCHSGSASLDAFLRNRDMLNPETVLLIAGQKAMFQDPWEILYVCELVNESPLVFCRYRHEVIPPLAWRILRAYTSWCSDLYQSLPPRPAADLHYVRSTLHLLPLFIQLGTRCLGSHLRSSHLSAVPGGVTCVHCVLSSFSLAVGLACIPLISTSPHLSGPHRAPTHSLQLHRVLSRPGRR